MLQEAIQFGQSVLGSGMLITWRLGSSRLHEQCVELEYDRAAKSHFMDYFTGFRSDEKSKLQHDFLKSFFCFRWKQTCQLKTLFWTIGIRYIFLTSKVLQGNSTHIYSKIKISVFRRYFIIINIFESLFGIEIKILCLKELYDTNDKICDNACINHFPDLFEITKFEEKIYLQIERTPEWNKNTAAVEKVATLTDHVDIIHVISKFSKKSLSKKLVESLHSFAGKLFEEIAFFPFIV